MELINGERPYTKFTSNGAGVIYCARLDDVCKFRNNTVIVGNLYDVSNHCEIAYHT
jgi:hypothetical protein